MPSPPLLVNTSTLPSPHRCLTVLYCRCHPPQLLSNTLFVAAASPPPHRCLSPPLSNAIVILHCHRCCCHPSPPSNADSRHRHPPPLVSNAIFALPSPCLSPSASLSNAVGRCRCHRTHLSPTPLKPVFTIVAAVALPPSHRRPLTKKEAAAAPPPAYRRQHQCENVYMSRRLGLM